MMHDPRLNTHWVLVHGTASDADDNRQSIDRAHRARGLAGIGYHYVITKDGTVERGRAEDTIGAHCRRNNHDSIGICVVGTASTPVQREALTKLIADITTRYPEVQVRLERTYKTDLETQEPTS